MYIQYLLIIKQIEIQKISRPDLPADSGESKEYPNAPPPYSKARVCPALLTVLQKNVYVNDQK